MEPIGINLPRFLAQVHYEFRDGKTAGTFMGNEQSQGQFNQVLHKDAIIPIDNTDYYVFDIRTEVMKYKAETLETGPEQSYLIKVTYVVEELSKKGK